MTGYVLKRLALMLLTYFIIISLCFILIRLLPNVPAAQFGKDQSLILERRVRQGLIDRDGHEIPLLRQYFHFVTRTLIGGDWGISESLYLGQDCRQVFLSKLPATVLVNLGAMLLSIPLGLVLGIYAALKKDRWQDRVISTGIMVFVSVPSYVYALLIQFFLCFRLGFFPLVMNAGTDYFSGSMLRSMFPCILSLSLASIAGFARYTRAELAEVLGSDYLLLARAKGLSRRQTALRHALRNAMVPILPMMIGEFVGILGGSLIIENIFVVPGVGPLYVNSILALDYNFFLLLSAFYTLVSLSSGILADISCALLDPRIRMGSVR